MRPNCAGNSTEKQTVVRYTNSRLHDVAREARCTQLSAKYNADSVPETASRIDPTLTRPVCRNVIPKVKCAILFRIRAFTRYCDGKRGASVQRARMNFETHVSITPIMLCYASLSLQSSHILRTDSIFLLISRDHRIPHAYGYASDCQRERRYRTLYRCSVQLISEVGFHINANE